MSVRSGVECCPAVKEDHNAPRGRRTFYEAISNRAEAADGEEKNKTAGSETFLHRWRRFLLPLPLGRGENLRESPRNSSNRSFHSWIMGRVVYYCSLVCLVLDGAGERRCLMRINPRPAPMGSESRVAGLIIPRHHPSAAERSLCARRRHCPHPTKTLSSARDGHFAASAKPALRWGVRHAMHISTFNEPNANDSQELVITVVGNRLRYK